MRIALALFVLVPLFALAVVAITSDLTELRGSPATPLDDLSPGVVGDVSDNLVPLVSRASSSHGHNTPASGSGTLTSVEACGGGVVTPPGGGGVDESAAPVLTPEDIAYALERVDLRSILADVMDHASDLEDLPWTRGRWVPEHEREEYELEPMVYRARDGRLWVRDTRLIDGWLESRAAPFFAQEPCLCESESAACRRGPAHHWARYQRFVNWRMQR